MALGKCPECGHVMSTTAAFCVNCGGTAPALLSEEQQDIRCIQSNGETVCNRAGGAGKVTVPSE